MKTPRDDFWMVLKAAPALVCVVFLHRGFPLPFSLALALGVPLGLLISRALSPLTRRLLDTRYAPLLDPRLSERPLDSGCGAAIFILVALTLYGILFSRPSRGYHAQSISSSPRRAAPPSSQPAKARSHSARVRQPAST